LINKATKLFDYFLTLNKEYVAEIKLGVVTDTRDLDGRVLAVRKVRDVSAAEISGILDKLTGKIEQKPPVFSSIKYKGKPSYKFARRGLDIDLKPRIVNIHDLELISLDKDLLIIKINCSSGTYIRSLAHEIGDRLGCGASVKGLKRLKIGNIELEDSINVEPFLKSDLKKSDLLTAPYMISIERLLKSSPDLYIKDEYKSQIINGHRINGEMIMSVKTGERDLTGKGILIKIKDSKENTIAIHEILSGINISGVKDKKLNLTKSIVIF